MSRSPKFPPEEGRFSNLALALFLAHPLMFLLFAGEAFEHDSLVFAPLLSIGGAIGLSYLWAKIPEGEARDRRVGLLVASYVWAVVFSLSMGFFLAWTHAVGGAFGAG